MRLSDKVRQLEDLEINEGQHYNTKVRQIDEKIGSKKIRLGMQETKKMIENMLNDEHPSPNPKSMNDRAILEDCKVLAEQMIPRLKEVKECKSKKMGESLAYMSEGDIDDEFVKYFNDFYGPDGLYKKANKTGKPYTKEQLEKALQKRNKERKFPFEGDSLDRETLRDRLGDMKLLNMGY